MGSWAVVFDALQVDAAAFRAWSFCSGAQLVQSI